MPVRISEGINAKYGGEKTETMEIAKKFAKLQDDSCESTKRGIANGICGNERLLVKRRINLCFHEVCKSGHVEIYSQGSEKRK